MGATPEVTDDETTILSIDGGGIRGVVPAVVLAAIEERTDNTPICELFDVIAGTSTGGILALGLSCPGEGERPRFRAGDLVEMYRTQGPRIFPHEFLGQIRRLFGPEYSEGGRREVLTERFGETRLKEALTEVIVTSYDIQGRRPIFFRRDQAKVSHTHDFAMRDVALATSAAPTYFRPVVLPDAESRSEMVLVDGGVYANNPGMCGFVDRTAAQGRRAGTLMVSLGTGELTKPLTYKEARGWGLIGWGTHIIDVVFDGVTEAVEYQLKTLLGPEAFYRFQVTLTPAEEPMDDVDPANIRALIELAEELVERPGGELDEVCEKLMSRRARRIERRA
jgi:patatin-like phospholipase/acyl hydrolase